MNNPEIIHITYSCANFKCKYGPESSCMLLEVGLQDYEKGNYIAPKCDKCNRDMIADCDEEIDDILWDAGIKPSSSTND